MSKFSENLTELRKNSGDTQSTLAEFLGVTNRTVSKWENGESEPEYAYLTAIAERYHTSVDFLLGIEVKIPENPYDNLPLVEIAKSYYRRIVEETRSMTGECMKSYRYGEVPEKTEAVVPEELFGGRQSGVTDNALFTNIVHGSDVNFLVSLMGNHDNYSWINSQTDELERFFTALGKPGMMKLMIALHTPGILDSFTADYAAELSGCAEKDVSEIMDILSESNFFSNYHDAELEEGVRRIYSYEGSGMIMALLCIAHEILCKQWSGNCIYNNTYKPIKQVYIGSKKEDVK